jgi:hypothetical protein
MMEISSLKVLLAASNEEKIRAINKGINSNWADVCDKKRFTAISIGVAAN